MTGVRPCIRRTPSKLTVAARRDLIGIFDRIAIDSPVAASKVTARLTASVDSLAQLSERSRVYRPSRTPSRVVHATTRRPYVIYYRVYRRSKTVVVTAVRHGRRQPPQRF